MNLSKDEVPPILREFRVTPEWIVDLSKGGQFEVTGPLLPPDAKVRLELTHWDEDRKWLIIVVESQFFPDIVEELKSPIFRRIKADSEGV